MSKPANTPLLGHLDNIPEAILFSPCLQADLFQFTPDSMGLTSLRQAILSRPMADHSSV